ncbi:MAG TPA: hypothetical protein VJG83_06030 [archaeon]|nr:hypothetical protein [archaeon]
MKKPLLKRAYLLRSIDEFMRWIRSAFEKFQSLWRRGRREIPLKGPHKDILAFLEKKLANKKFFEGLPKISKYSIRKFEYNGKTAVIKQTYGDSSHGIEFGKIRQTLLKHQMAVRTKKIVPKTYKLRSIKVFGRVGNYLVMDFVKGQNLGDWFDRHKNPEVARHLSEATYEMERNFNSQGALPIPQLTDLIVAGNTNPQEPTKGKWIFYLPYDYI